MLLFEIGNFNFGSVRNVGDGALNGGSHAQVIEDIHTEESLLDDNMMARLREVQNCGVVELATYVHPKL